MRMYSNPRLPDRRLGTAGNDDTTYHAGANARGKRRGKRRLKRRGRR